MLDIHNLHKYQNRGVDHMIDHPHVGLFMEMGLGKTVTTLTALDRLIFELFVIDKPLIVAPKKVVESVWEQEARNWRHLQHLTFSKIIGTPKQRLHAVKKQADIYLISRDNIRWLIEQYDGFYLPFDMLVIDESSSFKNHKSKRFAKLRFTLDTFKRRVILTGTPAPNGLEDLWSQVYILDKGERLEKYITKYRDKYFRINKRNGNVVYSYKIREDADQAIYDRIGDICMSMKADDYLELPPKIDNMVNVELPPDVLQLYNEFEREQILELLESGEEITAVNAAALLNKLLQFANGAVYDEERNWHVVHDEKIDRVKELLENDDGKNFLIAWTYRHDMYRLMKALKKYKPVQLKTDKHVVEWNKGNIRVMLMHPASGGHGLNLQKGGSRIIWFGQTWSLELYQQFNARLHRQGKKEPTIIHHLIAKGTEEKRVIETIRGKANKQEGLMQAVKMLAKKHKIKIPQ